MAKKTSSPSDIVKDLQTKVEQLKAQKEQMINNLTALVGAIQFTEQLIAEYSAPPAEEKKES